MIGDKVYTVKTKPVLVKPMTLSKIVEKDGVDAHYFLSESQRKKYEYLRGSKRFQEKIKMVLNICILKAQ